MTIFTTAHHPAPPGESTRDLRDYLITRTVPAAPPLPDQTFVHYVVEPLPQRVGLVMPDFATGETWPEVIPGMVHPAEPEPDYRTRPDRYRSRHRRPQPWWAWLTATFGAGVAVGAVVIGAGLAVIR